MVSDSAGLLYLFLFLLLWKLSSHTSSPPEYQSSKQENVKLDEDVDRMCPEYPKGCFRGGDVVAPQCWNVFHDGVESFETLYLIW